ncbi:hypothetical protein ACIQCR_14985 [Streptomyces sp. NPDC093249]|uniref:hypothetical protein n=1 Tax=unclassified Streptomyces TaxID=2593676 RepID=UPI00382E4989
MTHPRRDPIRENTLESYFEISGPTRSIEKLAEISRPTPDSTSRLHEIASKPGSDLPLWILKEFSAPLTREEKMEWLKQWRAAPREEKIQMEDSQGWEVSEWLHWFSPDNQYWKISTVTFGPGPEAMRIYIHHDDEPIPVGAIEWMISTAGASISEIKRIT